MSRSAPERVSTGIDGLDEILQGGIFRGRSYMISGTSGTGKTICGLEYLLAGVENDETGLFISFEESATTLAENAATLGFDISPLTILDLSPESDRFLEGQSYDIFTPDEVEREGITETITDTIDQVEPDRVVIDPLTQLRNLTPEEFQFRNDVASLLRYLTNRDVTVVFSTQAAFGEPDDLQFVSDGHIAIGFEEKGRVIEVTKFRGSGFQSGAHTMRITDTGIAVFPQLQPRDHDRSFEAETIGSGIETLDTMLSGGIDRGTVTVLSGPSGVGKTTLGTHFVKEAASRGERTVIYMFEEATETFLHRSGSIGIPIREMLDTGTLAVEEIEPLMVSPDEFARRVRTEVENNDAKVVMIDGTAGYRLSIRGENDDLRRELHALCRYLRNMGVTVLLIEETTAVTGEFQATQENISYLADNILFLRYLEMNSEINKAIGILKKRASDFERTLRTFEITAEGIELGDPLTGLRGILTGTPEWRSDQREPTAPQEPSGSADGDGH